MGKNPLGWLTQLFDLFGELFDIVKAESEETLQEIKSKVKYYMVVYGLFTVAMFFILIGFIKWLPTVTAWTEASSFMIVGSAMVVLLAFYTLIKNA